MYACGHKIFDTHCLGIYVNPNKALTFSQKRVRAKVFLLSTNYCWLATLNNLCAFALLFCLAPSVKEFLHINILDKPICTVGSFALCFSVSFPLAVCIFLCCNYNPLDGARQKRLQEPAPATNQSRGEGKQAPWPSDLFTKMTERVRHKSLASPATTRRRLGTKVLEEKEANI